MTENRSKRSRLKKIGFWILGILVVIRIAIPVVGVIVANKVLPGALGTKASIKSLALSITRGYVSTGDITIAQPDGFEGEPLFSLRKASINVSMTSLINGPITVQSVVVDSLSLNLIKNTNGVLNAEMLAGGGDTNAPAIEAPETTNATSTPPAIAIKKVEVRDLSVSYRDLTFDPPLVVHLDDCDISVTDLLFDPAQTDNKKLDGKVMLTALLKQPEMHDAFIGITARLGVLSTNVPAANAAVRIVGLELDLIHTALPPGISTTISATLGGSCLDAYADVAVAMDILQLKAKLKTADNTMHFAMGGTPLEPKVDKSTALFNLVGRPGALVGGVVTDVGGAGLQVIGGAAKTTAAVGKGALKVVGSLGKGLFKTAKGVATADLSEIGAGLKETTAGTVTEAAAAAVDTTAKAVEGIGDTALAAIGKADSDAWRDGGKTRWNTIWPEAKTKVAEAPYPAPKKKAQKERQPAENIETPATKEVITPDEETATEPVVEAETEAIEAKPEVDSTS